MPLDSDLTILETIIAILDFYLKRNHKDDKLNLDPQSVKTNKEYDLYRIIIDYEIRCINSDGYPDYDVQSFEYHVNLFSIEIDKIVFFLKFSLL